MTQDKLSTDQDKPSSQSGGEMSGKIIPPSSPVDVPNMPAPAKDLSSSTKGLASTKGVKTADPLPAGDAAQAGSNDVDAGTPAGAARKGDQESSTASGGPREIDPTTSSWADSTQPAPDKKNVRSSII